MYKYKLVTINCKTPWRSPRQSDETRRSIKEVLQLHVRSAVHWSSLLKKVVMVIFDLQLCHIMGCLDDVTSAFSLPVWRHHPSPPIKTLQHVTCVPLGQSQPSHQNKARCVMWSYSTTCSYCVRKTPISIPPQFNENPRHFICEMKKIAHDVIGVNVFFFRTSHKFWKRILFPFDREGS